ncbi:uncharacterized protein LOC120205202 [Hibiscus syriacus]|uniref:uncharacterized protein LOC120205202 n=1 Tax=Hibiscus syriacus TaxID=106335 RepID=UPI00192369FE|nr:uncharacterized protein LOC120205202 [Hibiscus syriacus]
MVHLDIPSVLNNFKLVETWNSEICCFKERRGNIRGIVKYGKPLSDCGSNHQRPFPVLKEYQLSKPESLLLYYVLNRALESSRKLGSYQRIIPRDLSVDQMLTLQHLMSHKIMAPALGTTAS